MVFTTSTYAENAWWKGTLYLKNGKTLHGSLNFDSDNGSIRIKNKSQQLAFHSSKVKLFQFLDEELGVNRVFISSHAISNEKKMKHDFFEVIVSGAVCVLRTEQEVIQDRRPEFDKLNPQAVFVAPSEKYLVYKYNYYLSIDGDLMDYKKFDKDIYPKLLKAEPKLKGIIESRKLDINEKQDQFLIIRHFNKLQNNEQLPFLDQQNMNSDPM
ncbi:MAG: hypothetical protein ACFCUU_07645 [Cyclobacteriaceae bacterium]